MISILSLVVAALAVFVGPFITLHLGKKQFELGAKQIELSRRIASKQIIAPMRQAWINTFREKLAELTGNAFHYWNAQMNAMTDEERRRLTQLEHEIQLLINPNEQDHEDLVAVIRHMLGVLEGRRDDEGQFIEAWNSATALGQKIFKTEWNRIKDDIEKP